MEPKAWGEHPETKHKVELTPGWSIISEDGTRYVVGDWEKNRETGELQLGLFEADGAVVYLAKEEKIGDGDEIILGEDPFVTEQFEWEYVKAKVRSVNPYDNVVTSDSDSVESEAIIRARRKANIERARKRNKELISELDEELGTTPVPKKKSSDVVEYDDRSDDEVAPTPTQRDIDMSHEDALNDLIDLQESLADELDNFGNEGAGEFDDDIEDEQDIFDRLAKQNGGTSANNAAPASKKRKPSKRGQKRQRSVDNAKPKGGRMKGAVDKDKLQNELEDGADEEKVVEIENARLDRLESQIAALSKQLSDLNFRDNPSASSNTTVAKDEKPKSDAGRTTELHLGAEEGVFGSKIEQIAAIKKNEDNIIKKAPLVNAICAMDNDTTNALLTIAKALLEKGGAGNCTIIVL